MMTNAIFVGQRIPCTLKNTKGVAVFWLHAASAPIKGRPMTEQKSTQQQEAEALEYLAGIECPECKGDGKRPCVGPSCRVLHDCDDCQGTGLRFLGLSRECRHWPHHIYLTPCSDCHGTGRIPVSVETGFLWLVGHFRFRELVMDDLSRQTYRSRWAGSGDWYNVGKGPTPALAVFAAVKAAVEE